MFDRGAPVATTRISGSGDRQGSPTKRASAQRGGQRLGRAAQPVRGRVTTGPGRGSAGRCASGGASAPSERAARQSTAPQPPRLHPGQGLPSARVEPA